MLPPTRSGGADAGISLVGVASDDGSAGSVRDHLRNATGMISGDRLQDVDVLVGDDPVTMLLQLATDSNTVLCLASHDHTKPVATLIHAVGSHVIERTTQPIVVVGPNLDEASLANESSSRSTRQRSRSTRVDHGGVDIALGAALRS